MSGTTSNYAFPYPESSDAPDGATQITDLAEAVDSELHDHVVQGGAVDTATTAIHHTLGTGSNQASRGTHSHAEFDNSAAYDDMRTYAHYDDTVITIPISTSASIVSGTAGGAVFTAPASGRVLIHLQAEFTAYNAGTYIGWKLNKGSSVGATSGVFATRTIPTNWLLGVNGYSATGVLTDTGVGDGVAPAHTHTLQTESIQVRMGGIPSIQEGLTPGDEYNVQYLFWNSDTNQSVTCSKRALIIQPVH